MAKRRIIRRAAPDRLGELQHDYLMDGDCLDPGAPEDLADCWLEPHRWLPFDSEEAMRAAWFAHRTQLMAASPKGKKPWAYEAFEGREGD